jgi:hypothetical protein
MRKRSLTRVGDLIRKHPSGAEVPAPGRWSIANSHVAVRLEGRRGLLGRVHAAAPWACGELVVADDVAALALVLHVGTPPRTGAGTMPGLARLLADDHLSEITLRVPIIEPAAAPTWRTQGVVSLGALSRPVPVSVTYHGVYRTALAAKAWLTVVTEIAHDSAGKRSRRPVRITADILAVNSTPTAVRPPGVGIAA